jgi:hypothetical protein
VGKTPQPVRFLTMPWIQSIPGLEKKYFTFGAINFVENLVSHITFLTSKPPQTGR